MRITKDSAYQAAKAMLAPKKEAAEAAEQIFRRRVRDAYVSAYPECVIQTRKTHPNYLNAVSEIVLDGWGFNHKNVGINYIDDDPNGDGWVATNHPETARLELNKQLATELKKMETHYQRLNKNYRDLFDQTETALVNLRTFSRIQENLPEAVPFLPKSTSFALVVNYDKLRKDLMKEPAPVLEESLS